MTVRQVVRVGSMLFLVAPVVAVSADSEREQVPSLVQAHESAIGLIHSLDLTLELHGRQFVGPKAGAPEEHLATVRWSKSGEMERIRNTSQGVAPNAEGRPRNLFDLFQDGTTRQVLTNWNPDNPQSISPVQQGSVKAYIEPVSPRLPDRDPAVFLLFAYRSVHPNEPRRSLAELVADSPKVRFLGNATVGNHDCLHLRVESPGVQGEPPDGSYFDFFLDPAANFHVRRLIEHYADYSWSDPGSEAPRKISVDWIREVGTFRDYGHGVFLPEAVSIRVQPSHRSSPTMIVRCDVDRVAVNTSLPKDALDFRFPQYVLVRYLPAVDGKMKVNLWGPQNQPIREIRGAEDLMVYADPSTQRPSWGRMLLLLAGLGVAVFVVWALIRRQHAR